MSSDPREQGAKPPYPEQRQQPPGLESEMEPRPDYGEESYRGSGRLRDRVAIVTGGDSGIGRAVALAFAREGADVAIAYLEEDSDAAETVRVVEDAGRRALSVRGDLGDDEHAREVVESTVEQFGRLDVLVNNAGFQTTHSSITEIAPELVEFVFRSNILSMFWLCQAAIPHMQPGSSIINTTSIQAFDPSPELVHYAATKGAIVTFTKALSQELTEKGIRVNAVAPGPVWTPLIPSTMPDEKIQHFGEDSDLERPAQPAELAPVYVFLASEESRYIAGETIGVTGGRLLPA